MTRTELLEILPKGCIGAELGVFKGDFSRKILTIVRPRRLVLIDKFEGIARSGDKDGKNIETIDFNTYFPFIKAEFIGHNVDLVKGDTSLISNYPDGFFDFVYIDADHSYKAVKADLERCHPKVKGWIMGHDYALRTEGVIKAVTEYCEKYKLKINYLTNDGCPSFAIKK